MSDGEDPQTSPAAQVYSYPVSKLAVASLVCGLLVLWPLRVIAAIPAVICGHLARREIKAAKGRMAGAGYAMFGLIIGYLDIAILVASAIALPFLAADVQHAFDQLQSTQAGH